MTIIQDYSEYSHRQASGRNPISHVGARFTADILPGRHRDVSTNVWPRRTHHGPRLGRRRVSFVETSIARTTRWDAIDEGRGGVRESLSARPSSARGWTTRPIESSTRGVVGSRAASAMGSVDEKPERTSRGRVLAHGSVPRGASVIILS